MEGRKDDEDGDDVDEEESRRFFLEKSHPPLSIMNQRT